MTLKLVPEYFVEALSVSTLRSQFTENRRPERMDSGSCINISETDLQQVDESILAMMLELQAMGDNAVYPPPTQQQVSSIPTKKKGSKPATITNDTANAWEMKPPNDAPAVSWTDSNFQYAIWNPANYGSLLVKIQVYKNDRLTHSSGIYMNETGKMYETLRELTTQLENEWVDRNTGVPKFDGLIRTAMPLSTWRQHNTVVSTNEGVKRKRSAVTSKRSRNDSKKRRSQQNVLKPATNS